MLNGLCGTQHSHTFLYLAIRDFLVEQRGVLLFGEHQTNHTVLESVHD